MLYLLLTTILSGVAIGIFISAPMGPIGVLCIQRTLTKGRLPGLYTGMGAALSDMLYCMLTGFGLSFVTDFIEGNQAALQIAGSLLLLAYAVYLFNSNPSRTLRTPADHHGTTYWRDFWTGFAFTFSNPLILFIIIGLFAQFNFMSPQMQFYHFILGYVAIAGGALLWWLLITYAVDKLRAHFNLRSMKLVNRVISVILAVMATAGIVHGITSLLNY